MSARKLCSAIFLAVSAALMMGSVSGLEKPKDISEEMYCIGCEITLKELDRILSRKPTRGMGETVHRALMKVCKEEYFVNYEVGKETLLTVCNHIKGDAGMEAVLVREYGKKHELGVQTSYLEISKFVCGTVLKACQSNIFNSPSEEDGGIDFDSKTQQFTVKPGKKVRMPEPVRQMEIPSPPVVDIHKDLKSANGNRPDLDQKQGHSHDEF